MFYSNPNLYALTDIGEDLPGPLRIPGMISKDVAPSLAIISKDPDERKKQIADALVRIRASSESKEGLGKEILNNVYNLGVKGFPLGTALAAAFHLASPRLPWKTVAGKRVLQSPTQITKKLKALFQRPGYAKKLGLKSMREGAVGAGMGVLSGVAYPLLANRLNVSDKALSEAAEIMQDQPYMTSLPGSEMVSVMRDTQAPTKAHKLLYGAGLGAAGGGLTATIPSLISYLGSAALNFKNRPARQQALQAFKQNLKKDIPKGLLLGGGLGGSSAMLTDTIASNDQT
jgi:hypothetical protein